VASLSNRSPERRRNRHVPCSAVRPHKGARLYTLNLFDEVTSHASAAGDLTHPCKLIADGLLDGQVEFEGSWREPSQALDALLEHRIGGNAVFHVD